MRQPDPKATEFQQFGMVGILITACTALGLAYAALKAIGWL
jgi:hypothetical protein